MDISKYFKLDRSKRTSHGILIYDFDDSLTAQFIDDCLIPFRQSYISDENLERNIAALGDLTTRTEEIKSVLPTKPNLKSGDFGEILSYAISSYIHPDTNLRPLKWRWKESNDSPCHFTDIVLLRCDDYTNPDTSDFLVAVESKSGATAPRKTESRINDAISGATKDITSRFSKTISYLMAKYKNERDFESVKIARRFSDCIAVPFGKHFKAIAIIDKDHITTHINNISNDLLTTYPQIEVYAVPMKDLKSIYESIYSNIPNT